jgi:hypothetical protein
MGVAVGVAPVSPLNHATERGPSSCQSHVGRDKEEPPSPGTPLGNAESKANLPQGAIRALEAFSTLPSRAFSSCYSSLSSWLLSAALQIRIFLHFEVA